MDVEHCAKSLEKLVHQDFQEVSEMVKKYVEANPDSGIIMEKLQEMKEVTSTVLTSVKSFKMESESLGAEVQEEKSQKSQSNQDEDMSTQSSLGTSSLLSTRRDEDINFPKGVEEGRNISSQDEELPRQQLHWNSRSEMTMPFGMSRNIQVVVLNDLMHIGGGNAERDCLENEYKIMSFNLTSKLWKITQYKAKWFAMVNVEDKLTLVGGQDENKKEMNTLGVLDDGKWTYPYSPMPTCRYKSSATAYKKHIVVAGGTTEKIESLSTIEILNLNNDQWHRVCNPPITPFHSMKSVVLDDTWYLMGGCIGAPVLFNVLAIQLNELIADKESNATWKKLPQLPCYYSSPVLVGRDLLAVGGSLNEPNILDTIYLYDRNKNKWVLAAKQPCAINNCACTVISNTLYIIGGWDGTIRRASIHTCSINEGQFYT